MKKILVAVLDWGLGHAARSCRIITELQREGHQIVIASSGDALRLLRQEFPNVPSYSLPETGVRYASGEFLIPNLLFRVPKWIRQIKEEHQQTSQIIHKERIDLVISDNRYGCYSETIYSIMVCHQMVIPLNGLWRIFKGFISWLQFLRIKKFNEVWVPDFSSRLLSGEMGFYPGLNVKYIGPLSRFGAETESQQPKKYFISAIISGPDPLRQKLVEKLEQILSKIDKPCLILTGQPGLTGQVAIKNKLTICGHLSTTQLQDAIIGSAYIIARSGYSSIMDFITLGSAVLYIPTPGQPEQEYLAQRMREAKLAEWLSEDDLMVSSVMSKLQDLKSVKLERNHSSLKKAIMDIP